MISFQTEQYNFGDSIENSFGEEKTKSGLEIECQTLSLFGRSWILFLAQKVNSLFMEIARVMV